MSTDTAPQDRIPLPETAEGIYAASVQVRRLREKNLSWREVSRQTGYSRVDALRLVHNLFELIDAANTAARTTVRTGTWYGDRLSA